MKLGYIIDLSEKTLACNKEKDVYGFKPNKERITAMVADFFERLKFLSFVILTTHVIKILTKRLSK
jgi:hypothetical protein